MDGTTFEDFRRDVIHLEARKKFKVNNSFGVYQVYKLIRKNKWYNIGRPLKEGEFYAIIRGVNKYLAQEIINGNTVVFPSRMGKLELRKNKVGVSIVDGKLKNTYPIDWYSTLRLWYEDAEEREKKTLVRHNTKQVFSVRYNKNKANYENKWYYEFVLNRFIKRALKDSILKDKVDTIW